MQERNLKVIEGLLFVLFILYGAYFYREEVER